MIFFDVGFLIFRVGGLVVLWYVVATVRVFAGRQGTFSCVRDVVFSRYVQILYQASHSSGIVRASVIARHVVGYFLRARRRASTFILSTMVVLVGNSIAKVYVVYRAILVRSYVDTFVVSRRHVLALPEPSDYYRLSRTVAQLTVSPVVSLANSKVYRVILCR